MELLFLPTGITNEFGDLKKREKELQAREAKLKREKELKRRKQRHKVNVESVNVQYQQ